MTDWLDEVQKMDSATLASLMKMGAKVQKLLEMKDKVKQVFGMSSAATSETEPQVPATEALVAYSEASPPTANTPENPKHEH
jgi:hypothetical protein